MQHLQTLECVTERDIDLLLLEELNVSAHFQVWFIEQVCVNRLLFGRFIGAWHSISHLTLGESDIIVVFEDINGIRTAILIENKIDAPPQSDQATRYHLRGQDGVIKNNWKQFQTCIIAPELYLKKTGDANLYDVRISYETIRGWFSQPISDQDALRAKYRANIIGEAIEQNRRDYQPKPHVEVTQFWSDYWKVATTEFPQLQMKKPGNVPENSDWPEFRPHEVGPNRKILHKWAKGVVHLQISSAGALVEQIKAQNQEILINGLDVVRTKNSASIQLNVPMIDRFGDFASQVEAIRLSLSAAVRLLLLSPHIQLP
jgi:hypothetical protein